MRNIFGASEFSWNVLAWQMSGTIFRYPYLAIRGNNHTGQAELEWPMELARCALSMGSLVS